MSDTNNKHDDLLFELLKESKTLPNFLDKMFGFLQRRTDFYVIADKSNAAVGLPEGLAEKLVRHTFYNWKPQPLEVVYNDSDIPTATEETVIINTDEIDEVTSTTYDLSCGKIETEDFEFNKSEFYNGAVYENYCWSQTILEVNIILIVPENITKKDINVTITPYKISIKLKDGTYLVNGDLFQKCKANDAIWSIDGRKMEIHLDKCQDMWWNCLITSEPELDISKIDCTRPYEDLPEEAQVKIEELQWNQERKRLGLPTSQEIILQEKLKKSWNVEGSPFNGPFDPSAVSFS